MNLRYMVSRPGGDRTKAIGFARARRIVRGQLNKYAATRDRKMRVKERSADEWGTWRSDVGAVLDVWAREIAAAKDGDVVLIDIEDYPYTVSTRVINDEQPTIASDGNHDIDKIWTWLLRNEKGRNGGICNRRPIAGSSTWSQHSPWPSPDPGSNAVDWFSYPDTMDALYDQGARLATAARTDPVEVPVGLILVGSKAWTPSAGWHTSGAEYHRHLHIQGRKTRTGTPRAACP